MFREILLCGTSIGLCLGSAWAQTSGSFGILAGNTYNPTQQSVRPAGINVMNSSGNNPSAATLKSLFPGIGIVRLAIYNYDSPAALAPFVTDLTSNSIIVILENHNNAAGNAGGGQGPIFSGALLDNESNWYTSIASAFKGNPYVWFGTNNEPPSAPGLSQWQLATYNAIRGTGNNSPILVEMNSYSPASTGQGYDPSVYAQMSNILWDVHFYGWLVPNYAPDQALATQVLNGIVAQAQTIKGAGGQTIPVFIGETGNSTTGAAIDGNGVQVIDAVGGSGLPFTAWAWGCGGPGDGLTCGNGLTSYGQQVAGYISGHASPASGGSSNVTLTTPTAANSGSTDQGVASLAASQSAAFANGPMTPQGDAYVNSLLQQGAAQSTLVVPATDQAVQQVLSGGGMAAQAEALTQQADVLLQQAQADMTAAGLQVPQSTATPIAGQPWNTPPSTDPDADNAITAQMNAAQAQGDATAARARSILRQVQRGGS